MLSNNEFRQKIQEAIARSKGTTPADVLIANANVYAVFPADPVLGWHVSPIRGNYDPLELADEFEVIMCRDADEAINWLLWYRGYCDAKRGAPLKKGQASKAPKIAASG
jgi:hypothetical protein